MGSQNQIVQPAVSIPFLASATHTVLWQECVPQACCPTQLRRYFLADSSATHTVCMGSPCQPYNSSLTLLYEQPASSWWQRPFPGALIPGGGGRKRRAENLALALVWLPGHYGFSGWKDAYSFSHPYTTCNRPASQERMLITMASVVARYTHEFKS